MKICKQVCFFIALVPWATLWHLYLLLQKTEFSTTSVVGAIILFGIQIVCAAVYLTLESKHFS